MIREILIVFACVCVGVLLGLALLRATPGYPYRDRMAGPDCTGQITQAGGGTTQYDLSAFRGVEVLDPATVEWRGPWSGGDPVRVDRVESWRRLPVPWDAPYLSVHGLSRRLLPTCRRVAGCCDWLRGGEE